MAKREDARGSVGDLGEFGLIGRIAQRLGSPVGDVVAGIGDDTAAVSFSPGNLVLATTDGLVEGVHFLRPGIDPESLGRKALAVNQSDVAAMGGLPRFALVSLSVPADLPVSYLDDVYTGLATQARAFDMQIIGGNVTRSPAGMVLDVTVLGEVEPERLVLRGGASPGDSLMVTGNLGASAAGLALLLAEQGPGEGFEVLREAHYLPVPRVAEARALGETMAVTAMIDLSDGLGGDLGHLCDASGVGAIIYAGSLPILDETRAAAAALGRPALDLALYGGEDYELLLAVRPSLEERARDAVRMATGLQLTPIGEVTGEAGVIVLRHGDGTDERLVPARGHDHFRQRLPEP